MNKNILIILGHPDSESFCGAIASAYESGAKVSGRQVKRIDLGRLRFDPVLHKGYREIQPLEPDLLEAKEAVVQADHIVFAYPVWWGAPPALLKGFFDRLFLPGFAFRFDGAKSVSWQRLLSNRSARLLVTMDTPPWYYRLVYRMPGHNQMKRTILNFCGIHPVRISEFGPIRTSNTGQRRKWLDEASALGRIGK
ncbi:MAG: NAD(P)H-dependent oxidoreductase [Chlorobiaceae bacterium]|nr:NAD(P)H-dependent oxidoreductase [Chlorobiaceae bacterium]NTV59846.1 NAD(P)H-dependent oxidoreductase [Chlorobiaceae bacterium]